MKLFLVSTLAALAVASVVPQKKVYRREAGVVRRDGGGSCGSNAALVTPMIYPDYQDYGSPFCVSSFGTDYTPISNLTVWSDGSYVRGIQATYVDGTMDALIGQTTGSKQTISVNYALGETWSRVIVYSPPHNGNVNHLYLKNSNGVFINAGEPVADGLTPHEINVGGGILLGYTGTSKNIINSLGFLFLASPIKTVAISNLQFPNFPTGNNGITVEHLDGVHHWNGQSNDQTWSFAETQSKTITKAFQQTTTSAYQEQHNFQLSITAKIPGIGLDSESGQTQSNYQWTVTDAYQTTDTTATTISVTWNTGGTLHPGQGIDCLAVTGTAAGSYEYTSDVTITLVNGASYSFHEIGYLHLDDTSVDAVVLVTEADHP